MSFENEIDKTVKNVRDGIDEAGHRSAAEGERAKRDLAGDAMTPGEKAGSAANELKNDVEAGVDRMKRDIRNA
ncbi:MAG: hypothetical protein JO359_07065 [Candidatus Eremiobacteraeota bacterium]|nr:hypothetical protein [Candidatus Eremiobacteraeota bacterium]